MLLGLLLPRLEGGTVSLLPFTALLGALFRGRLPGRAFDRGTGSVLAGGRCRIGTRGRTLASWLERSRLARRGCRRGPPGPLLLAPRVVRRLGGELGAALRRAGAPLLLVELELARAQGIEPAATLHLGIVDARRDDEAIPTLARALGIARLDRGALFGDPMALGIVGSGRTRRRGDHERSGQRERSGRTHRERRKSERVHVSDVSTLLRASARKSAERISLSRETVRGNSCTSGPSVYNASGSTSADMMSLTRRS